MLDDGMKRIVSGAAVIENDFVKQWKGNGRPVLGYICTATPVEVMEAGGILPYRIRALGNGQTQTADAHLSRFNCSFCRSCLQLVLDGRYAFLDGVVGTNGCDHLRGMMENWCYAGKTGFFHYLKVPHVADPISLGFFAENLALYRQALEQRFKVTISDEDIWDKIEAQNEVRRRLRTLYRMRARESPALTGAEALRVFLLATAMPSGQLLPLLDQLIASREGHAVNGGRARLLLGGSATDEVEFVEMIEDLGGLVVADALCYGNRAFWADTEIKRGTVPMPALAETYLGGLLCPRMFDDFSSRKKFVLEAARSTGADGAVLVHNKFCDLHGVDNVQLRLALEAEGIPVLTIEKEYGALADMGRMKTRVQAFLERIG
jgi:benzoyl-CoA reductase subunit C